MKKCKLLTSFVLLALGVTAQLRYAEHSVLSSGIWLKVSASSKGVYSVYAADLKSLGLDNVPSGRIKLYGNGGGVLPESNSGVTPDDLSELAIWMEDGGDGQFSGSDYFLFYAPGTDQWIWDSLSAKFVFAKNFYADKAFYYITLNESVGKRVQKEKAITGDFKSVTSFDEQYRYELDSINFLRSGKEWYGEDFGNQTGRLADRTFTAAPSGVVPGTRFLFTSEIAGRSADQPNRMAVAINGKRIFEHTTAPLAGTLLEPSANTSRISAEGIAASGSLSVAYSFTGLSVNAQAWLNWFEVHYRRSLDMAGLPQLVFKDPASVAKGETVVFKIANPRNDATVWDVTDFSDAVHIPVTSQNNQLSFIRGVSSLRTYVVFSAASANRITVEGSVANQDLHGLAPVDMLIVTDPNLLQAAERLASFHRSQGLSVHIETPSRIYNEFSSGIPDPTAIRNFVRMFYVRSNPGSGKSPRFLLLFGGASYQYKGTAAANTNKVPSYQSDVSLDPLSTYVTDDYFGYLDAWEDIQSAQPAPMLDLAIGRIPARTLQQANRVVDKILRYNQPASLGSWRTGLTLVADDEDFNLHLYDAEYHAEMIERDFPSWQVKKIYLDAFEQQSNAGGSSYPKANKNILEDVNKGTLIWNYSGHGGSSRLAQETIIDAATLAGWENTTRLPLLVTATCDFAPFDDPDQFSLGEELLVGRNNGGIGLMTTTRLVFASSNKVINHNFLRYILKKDSNGRYPALGEALRDSKNFTVSTNGDYVNARKFIMLGDPAMKLSIPEYTVKTTRINDRPLNSNADTLTARSTYILEGVVLDQSGKELSDFNGFVYPRLFDKPVVEKTKANDGQSFAVDYLSDGGILYTGKVPVANGKFRFTFTVPADADARFGQVKLMYYADDGRRDAMGIDNHFVLGGRSAAVVKDDAGPVISAYLDKETFKSGDRVNQTPLLLLKLTDASGFNISGNGIGHDMVAILDGDARSTMILNDFFVPESVQSGFAGSVSIRLLELSEGRHSLYVRAWDVYNNAGEAVIEFDVVKQRDIRITSLKVFPNPLTQQSVFSLTMDGDTRDSKVLLTIFAGNGQMIWQQQKAINEANLRSLTVPWNELGKQDGSLPPGVYFCRVIVLNKEGLKTSKTVKLVIL
ncbi:MAG: type secretion system sortase PorU [Bacteroidota bacterium]